MKDWIADLYEEAVEIAGEHPTLDCVDFMALTMGRTITLDEDLIVEIEED